MILEECSYKWATPCWHLEYKLKLKGDYKVTGVLQET